MSKIADDIANMTRHLYNNLQREKADMGIVPNEPIPTSISVPALVRVRTSANVHVDGIAAGRMAEHIMPYPEYVSGTVYETETVYGEDGFAVGISAPHNGFIHDEVSQLSEQLYTYKLITHPDGRQTYERVPFDPATARSGDVAVPRRAPFIKNGEQPGMGSVALEHILRNTEAARSRRALSDALEAQAEEERHLKALGYPQRPDDEPEAKPVPKRYGRVLEP